MKRRQNAVLLDIGLPLANDSPEPMHRQLYERITGLIRGGTLAPGARLPASRAMAARLGIARNTVLAAYENLISDGFLSAGQGSGTFVADTLPQPARAPEALKAPAASRREALNQERYSHVFSALQLSLPALPFRPNFPDLDAFPLGKWTALTTRNIRRLAADPGRALLGEGSPSGYPELRSAIAEHLRVVRGIGCRAENILVFAGADQALDVSLRVLVGREDDVWCEDPCYRGASAALLAHCKTVHGIPVDRDGMQVEQAIERFPDARLAYVFPSNQYPMCVTMSMERRKKLLDWATHHERWIIEADYDSELRYSGQPLPSLKAMDRSNCVIHIGTFGKILFPSLRLGYAVVPDNLLDAFIGARSVAGRYPLLDQMLTYDFMVNGSFSRHIARMRKLYGTRQTILLDLLNRHLPGRIEAQPSATGMQVLARLEPGVDDSALAARATAAGLEVTGLSSLAISCKVDPAVILGFAAFPAEALQAGVARLAQVFEEAIPASVRN